ncbi:uncharacterized protein LOC103277800 [Anolis carolinensis]|uniref:uncharacterized protein LOC103277800 n=1 Tax=Anolis carolinensis TaxID=28377 RepID=UPI002F2B575E
MYDDTEAPSGEEGLPQWSCRPLPAEPTEKTEHVEDEYESFGEESSYGRIPFPSERKKPNTQAKQPSPSINSFTAEPAFTPAFWKGFWKRNGMLVVLPVLVGCLVIDMILLSQYAAMFSELRKLNFTPTTDICEPSTAPLYIEELKSTLIAEFRTLENHVDEKYKASDRKMEKEISRLEEKLSAMENRQG